MRTIAKFGGYKNRILRVNLTERTFKEETLSESLIHDYIGGRGFGAKLLYDDLKPGINPLGEENELISLTGPITRTSCAILPSVEGHFQVSSDWSVFHFFRWRALCSRAEGCRL